MLIRCSPAGRSAAGQGCGVILLSLVALARGVAVAGPERPPLPSWSMAGDDGALSLWSNPANLALDPDPTWGVLYTTNLQDTRDNAIAGAANTGPLGMGLAYRSGASGQAWWTISSGVGVKLDRSLGLGLQAGWQLPEGQANNFVTWDLGLSWRPLSWLGMTVVGQNMGTPASRGVDAGIGAGAVLRPHGDRLLLGAEYLWTGDPNEWLAGVVTGTLRYNIKEGLVLRGSGDSAGGFSAGLQLFFGHQGIGVHGRYDDTAAESLATLYGTASRAERRLIGKVERVASFSLNGAYPYETSSGLFSSPEETWLELEERIRAATRDPQVRGLVLQLDRTPFSFAQIEELRELIADARARGKTVVAYLDRASSNGAYMLACAADKVLLHPAGELDLVGLSMQQQYLRGTFDLIGVEPQFVKRAEYKAAPEGYTEYGSTGPAREQLNALLDDLSGRLVSTIAVDRRRTEDQVKSLIDQGPFTALEAQDRGLVDGLAYPDELDEKLAELIGSHLDTVDDYGSDPDHPGWRPAHELAVVFVHGVINSGPTRPPGLFGGGWSTGADTVIHQLERARREDSVEAVVLRVDSPGGSAFASDEIWRAVDRVERSGKPVIVSMGGLAASGGYYVSAGATAIYAEPTTITGSIGVYSGKFSLEGLYEKLGIQNEVYTRGRHAGMNTDTRVMDDSELAAVDRMVGETYRQFKARVEQGRSMDSDKVQQVARGRVWSGKAALEQGLVDELGGFSRAVERARKEAGLSERAEVALVTYDYRLGPGGEAVRSTARAALAGLGLQVTRLPSLALPSPLNQIETWKILQDERVLALLPYELEVR